MIYDCFLFFNELKILELRLEELDAVVDRFVLVEGSRTFSGSPKPLYFHENRQLFQRYLHKINHVVVNDLPSNTESAWDLEAFQRNAILRGIEGAAPEDVIVISDVDEIPRSSIVQSFTGGACAIEVEDFYYKLNCRDLNITTVGPAMITRKLLQDPQDVRVRARRFWSTSMAVIPKGGWHFSFIQDSEGVQQKLGAFSHQEYNTPKYTDPMRIQKRVRFGLDIFDRRNHYWCAVPLDETFPRSLREHPERFQDLLFDFKTFHMGRQDLIYSLQDELAETPVLLEQREAELETANARVREIGTMWANATRWKRVILGLLSMPVDWLIASALIATRLVARVVPGKAPCEGVKDTSRCSIIIVVTQADEDRIVKCLTKLFEALRFHAADHEVVLLEACGNSIRQELYKQFPEIRGVRGYGQLSFSIENAIKEAKNDVVILLTDDFTVDKNFLEPLLQAFKSPDVFTVSSQTVPNDSGTFCYETGKTRARLIGAELHWSDEPVCPCDEQRQYLPVFWGNGTAAAIDRNKFAWLGGWNNLPQSFQLQHEDISYAAWKVGWQCLLAPGSKIRKSSRANYKSKSLCANARRDEYLLVWTNTTDTGKLGTIARETFRNRIRRAAMPGVGVRGEVGVLLSALKHFPEVIARRFRRARFVVRTDEETLRLAASLDVIQKSALDLADPAIADHLGDGWYEVEGSEGKRFRWMQSRATVYLRVPSVNAKLVLNGVVPPLASYKAQPVALTLSCDGQQKRVQLREGHLKIQWCLSDLPAGFAVEVRLSVNQTIRSEKDKRVLSLVLNTIGLLAEFVQENRLRSSTQVPTGEVKVQRRTQAGLI